MLTHWLKPLTADIHLNILGRLSRNDELLIYLCQGKFQLMLDHFKPFFLLFYKGTQLIYNFQLFNFFLFQCGEEKHIIAWQQQDIIFYLMFSFLKINKYISLHSIVFFTDVDVKLLVEIGDVSPHHFFLMEHTVPKTASRSMKSYSSGLKYNKAKKLVLLFLYFQRQFISTILKRHCLLKKWLNLTFSEFCLDSVFP